MAFSSEGGTVALVTDARRKFHRSLVESGVLWADAEGVPSNADRSQNSSRRLAQGIVDRLDLELGSTKISGQTAGKAFEEAVTIFLASLLPELAHLRPAEWEVENVGSSRGHYHLANFIPYTHLDELARAIERDPTLNAVLGNSYDISPDVLVTRRPITDAAINAGRLIVDASTATRSPLRLSNQARSIVHAVISCKWTLRSDRAQNARSEALGVIRNRKGRTPHIAVVTAEPAPSRLASLALGTGDLDTVYHFALPELYESALHLGNDETLTAISTLIDGDRLRDITDLPLDLVV